jgi:hypothetical protein
LVRGIPLVEVYSPAPSELAAHWSRILQVPLSADEGDMPALHFDLGAARFVASPAASAERLAVLHAEVGDVEGACARALEAGLAHEAGGFSLAGVRFVLQPAADPEARASGQPVESTSGSCHDRER